MAKEKEPKKRDMYSGASITENAIEIISRYDEGVLTLRALHYQLVAIGMTNSIQHYKRVVSAMIDARWAGIVNFSAFSDHDRSVLGETKYEETDLDSSVRKAKRAIYGWMNWYSKNRWENQPYYPEVWIEKKALQGVFEIPCNEFDVLLAPCKGYPSLTFLYEAVQRFEAAQQAGKQTIILYFGDYDASGEDIPRSIEENFIKFGTPVEVKRIALTEQQVVAWKLPPAPTKSTDTRAANWEGLGQVELDAVDIKLLQTMCREAIEEVFDEDLYEELHETIETEQTDYVKLIQEYVNGLNREETDEDDNN